MLPYWKPKETWQELQSEEANGFDALTQAISLSAKCCRFYYVFDSDQLTEENRSNWLLWGSMAHDIHAIDDDGPHPKDWSLRDGSCAFVAGQFDLVSEGDSTTSPISLSVYEVVEHDEWSKDRPIFSVSSSMKAGEGLISLYKCLFNHEVSRKKLIVGSAVGILREVHDRR